MTDLVTHAAANEPADTTAARPGCDELDPTDTTAARPGRDELDPADTTAARPGCDELDPTALARSAALDSRAAHPAVDADAELIARRALGAAMNRLADGDHSPWIPSGDPDVIERARALLLTRVPAGPELATALELLDAVAPPAGVTLLP